MCLVLCLCFLSPGVLGAANTTVPARADNPGLLAELKALVAWHAAYDDAQMDGVIQYVGTLGSNTSTATLTGIKTSFDSTAASVQSASTVSAIKQDWSLMRSDLTDFKTQTKQIINATSTGSKSGLKAAINASLARNKGAIDQLYIAYWDARTKSRMDAFDDSTKERDKLLSDFALKLNQTGITPPSSDHLTAPNANATLGSSAGLTQTRQLLADATDLSRQIDAQRDPLQKGYEDQNTTELIPVYTTLHRLSMAFVQDVKKLDLLLRGTPHDTGTNLVTTTIPGGKP